MTGFRCGCGPAIDCTYPKCREGVEMSSKDITERLQDYARDYTTTTYHDDLIREAITEIESLRQQLAAAQEDTHRLDFMEAFGGEHICQLGSGFYYRAGFNQPHAKANTLREAIDGAIRLVKEQGK